MKSRSHHTLNLALASLLGIVAYPAARAATTTAPKPANPAALFQSYDQNGDKQVTLEEFSAQGGQESAFKSGDANADGNLSVDEFAKVMATHNSAKSSKFISDALITAKVKAMLLKDDSIKGLDVNVETHQGMVQLSGTVASPAQLVDAGRLAASVEGVRSVRNDLQIKTRS